MRAGVDYRLCEWFGLPVYRPGWWVVRSGVRSRDRRSRVERHGSESYFVLGEGLLGESLGGRPEAPAIAVAGAAVVPAFRFSRLGPKGAGKQLGEPNRRKIAQAMTAGNLSPGQIPAGY